MRILLVEDDQLIADALGTALRNSGYVLDAVKTLREAEASLATDYALVLLDLGLPDGNGIDLLRRIRARKQALPVIVLTARDRASDRVRGLDLGADDYVVKPFDLHEIEARIRAVTRRAGAGIAAELQLGPLRLIREARRAQIDDRMLELTPREYTLLELLLMRQGRVVSKAQIEEQLCDWDSGLSDAAIEVLVHRLRKKLDGASGIELRTLRGFGYLLGDGSPVIKAWSAHSLQGRLLRRLLLVTTLVVGIGAVFTFGLAQHFADRVFDAWLADTAESLGDLVVGNTDFADPALIQAIEQQVRFDETDAVSFMVSGPRGLIAGRADIPPPPSTQLGARRRGAQLYDAHIGGRAVRVARLDLRRDNGGAFTIAVAETLLKRRLVASELLVAALIPALLLALVAALLIVSGVHRALTPLDTISTALAQRDPLDLKPLANGELSEIQPLINAVNDLLARLQLALDAQRSFVADTAHQLRNPLAGIKLQIEEALRRAEPLTHERLRHLLGGVERASRLATQLLALARAEADATQAATPIEVFDLEQLAAERGRDWAPRLLRNNLQIQLDAPETVVRARGRPLLLAEAIDNLLDNALRYAGAGAQLKLIIEAAGDEVWLTIADNGPGFPPALKDTLFRRFSRGDHSSGDGAGLGLAIVRELLRAQQGEAEAVTLIGSRGAAIRLRLRAA